MASEKQIAANRQNAEKSTGPKTESGKSRSRSNAVRHRLAIGADRDSTLREDVEKLARVFSSACNEAQITLFTQDAAVAQIDLLRIRKIRASFFEAFFKNDRSAETVDQLSKQLRKLDRYERRAFSRRRRALGLC
jgi:uncharacterized membrane-anchored protein YjiN (DUF445 family)